MHNARKPPTAGRHHCRRPAKLSDEQKNFRNSESAAVDAQRPTNNQQCVRKKVLKDLLNKAQKNPQALILNKFKEYSQKTKKAHLLDPEYMIPVKVGKSIPDHNLMKQLLSNFILKASSTVKPGESKSQPQLEDKPRQKRVANDDACVSKTQSDPVVLNNKKQQKQVDFRQERHKERMKQKSTSDLRARRRQKTPVRRPSNKGSTNKVAVDARDSCHQNRQNFACNNQDANLMARADLPLSRHDTQDTKDDRQIYTVEDLESHIRKKSAYRSSCLLLDPFRKKNEENYEVVKKTLKNFSFDKHFPLIQSHDSSPSDCGDVVKRDSFVSLYRKSSSRETACSETAWETEVEDAKREVEVTNAGDGDEQKSQTETLTQSKVACNTEAAAKTDSVTPKSFVRQQVEKYNELIGAGGKNKPYEVKKNKVSVHVKPRSKFNWKNHNCDKLVESIKKRVSQYEVPHFSESDGEYNSLRDVLQLVFQKVVDLKLLRAQVE